MSSLHSDSQRTAAGASPSRYDSAPRLHAATWERSTFHTATHRSRASASRPSSTAAFACAMRRALVSEGRSAAALAATVKSASPSEMPRRTWLCTV
ncbi:hypothetical protein BE18_31315 [Sorangium cellulosum]|uniref:Uncharacterized protein n=1 Tax=Sorangium cellulosum TaxID=56 RepID=A0A150SN65_SORCE|nr:hypothetical protein BE18_31315 [Sorangium cellulosum]